MTAATRTAAPAAMKCLTVTSSQLEDIRAALVERRGSLVELRSLTYFVGDKTHLDSQVMRVDEILVLVAKS